MKATVVLPIVLSSVAIVVSVTSLGWQIISWRRSGAVVRVQVGQAMPIPPFGEAPWHTQVTALNGGRAPVSVVGWGLRFPGRAGNLAALRRSPYDASMPHRLEPGAQGSWMLPTEEVVRICVEQGIRYQQVRAFVRLGDGRTVFAPRRRRGIGLK